MANKIFPRNTKKKFEEKNDVSRVTQKSAILTIKKSWKFQKGLTSVSKMSQNKVDINI